MQRLFELLLFAYIIIPFSHYPIEKKNHIKKEEDKKKTRRNLKYNKFTSSRSLFTKVLIERLHNLRALRKVYNISEKAIKYYFKPVTKFLKIAIVAQVSKH